MEQLIFSCQGPLSSFPVIRSSPFQPTGYLVLRRGYWYHYLLQPLGPYYYHHHHHHHHHHLGLCSPAWAMGSSSTRFRDHTQRRATVGRTPLDVWSARRRDLYLITHNTHNRQTSMPPTGFEPTIAISERPLTYALDCAAAGIGNGVT
jgi:hypothetical protein